MRQAEAKEVEDVGGKKQQSTTPAKVRASAIRGMLGSARPMLETEGSNFRGTRIVDFRTFARGVYLRTKCDRRKR